MAVPRSHNLGYYGFCTRISKKCTKCGNDGHFEAACFEIIRYPPSLEHQQTKATTSFPNNSKQATARSKYGTCVQAPSTSSVIPSLFDENYRQLIDLLQASANNFSVISSLTSKSTLPWIIDIGASAYISSIISLSTITNVSHHSQFLTLLQVSQLKLLIRAIFVSLRT